MGAEHFGHALSTGGSDPLVDGQRLPQVGRAFGTVAVPEPVLLHDGDLVRFANHGFLVHMIVAARARSAAGAREIARLLKRADMERVIRIAK